MSTSNRSERLLALADLVHEAARVLVEEWEQEDSQLSLQQAGQQESSLPSWKVYDAQRSIVAACGALTEIVHNPQLRLLEVGAGFLESRALHIAGEHRIADIFAANDKHNDRGMPIEDLSVKTGIDAHKLARVMRALTSAHIFAEVAENHFANNHVSSALVGNEPLRATLMLFGTDFYTASTKLPDVLRDPVQGTSTSATCTAFNKAFQTNLTLFDWLEEMVQLPDGSFGPNPSMQTFALGMTGSGRVMASAVYHDFPWKSLGNGTVVDVGGGIGSIILDLFKMFPALKFVIEDRPAVIEEARGFWQAECPGALEDRVSLLEHDFFRENPVKGADAYLLRYILHGWDDDRCVDILKAIRLSMDAHSRVLVIDQIMNSTVGCSDFRSAPRPLPYDYGICTRMAHELDLTIMTVRNGVERTPSQLRFIASRAGLEVAKLWECRGILSIVEMRVPSGN